MNTAASLREGVRQAYSQIASHPDEEPIFPTGRALAEDLGYPAPLLDALPSISVEAFCGVSNVSLFAEIPEGSTVLDLGSGAGLDTLVAARRTGKGGKVIAVDFSQAMVERARQAITEAKATNVDLYLADAERLPLADRSIDVAIVNGIFNLNPWRGEVFAELARVVRPGDRSTQASSCCLLPGPTGSSRRQQTGTLERPEQRRAALSWTSFGPRDLAMPDFCAPSVMPEPVTRAYWQQKSSPVDADASATPYVSVSRKSARFRAAATRALCERLW